MKDDVTEYAKKKRLQELIDIFHSIASVKNKRFIGSDQLVLVENVSPRMPIDDELILL